MNKQERNEAFLDQRNKLSDIVADILMGEVTDLEAIKEALAVAVTNMKDSKDVTCHYMKGAAKKYYNKSPRISDALHIKFTPGPRDTTLQAKFNENQSI